jgi:hypothetical protein
MNSPIITLSNGKKVINFSSPHDFHFVDGTILPRVSDEDAERLKVTFIENLHDNGDVELSFNLGPEIGTRMMECKTLWDNDLVDVVYCPLPMITALKESGYDLKNSPFRAIRIEDRIKKLVSIDKQCL